MATWKEWIQTRRETPGFLKRTWEKKALGVIGDVFDTITDAMLRSRIAGWVSHPEVPTDGLNRKGRERQIPRYPGESDGDYAIRLREAWTLWSEAGFRSQLISTIEGYGFSGVYIVGTYEWDGGTYPAWSDSSELDNWSRFWVYVPHDGHPFEPDGNWDDPGDWDDGGLWDFENMTRQMFVDIRNLLEFYRPAHEIPVRIRFLLEPGSFTDVDTWSGESISMDLYI